MKYKLKSIPLLKAKLKPHPLLIESTKNDVIQLRANQSIDGLPIEVVQLLLDLHPLAAIIDTDDNSYLTLTTTSGILERFKAHPLKAKLNLRLLIYPQEVTEQVLLTTLLFDGALTLFSKTNLSTNIKHRLNCIKEQGIATPKQYVLANLANTAPSTFR